MMKRFFLTVLTFSMFHAFSGIASASEISNCFDIKDISFAKVDKDGHIGGTIKAGDVYVTISAQGQLEPYQYRAGNGSFVNAKYLKIFQNPNINAKDMVIIFDEPVVMVDMIGDSKPYKYRGPGVTSINITNMSNIKTISACPNDSPEIFGRSIGGQSSSSLEMLTD